MDYKLDCKINILFSEINIYINLFRVKDVKFT